MSLPARLTLSGSHVAAGVIVRDRESALALWTPGAVVHELEERVLVLFAEPRRLRAELTRGALVIAREETLSTMELAPEVLRDAAAGALLEARGGALRVHALDDRARRDPVEWVELSGVELMSATPLGPEPAPARPPDAKLAEDARQAIGGAIPEPAEGAHEAAVAITRALRGGAETHALAPRGSLFGWLVARLRSMLERQAAPSSQSALARRGPSFLDRVRGWLATLVLRTRFSRHLARRHAEYLARVFELFDRGDIREALRWAIPLGGPDAESAPPSLALPGPRQDLALSAHPGGSSSAIPLEGDLYFLLGQQYRRVLEQLRERGMVDEAAFVLAELLHDAAGAVALLEREGRFEQAARLAEARDLAPATQVRSWMLARNAARAVRIARLHDAFAEAVAILGRTHREAALSSRSNGPTCSLRPAITPARSTPREMCRAPRVSFGPGSSARSTSAGARGRGCWHGVPRSPPNASTTPVIACSR